MLLRFFHKKHWNLLDYLGVLFLFTIFSLVTFTPNSYATDTAYKYGNLTIYAQICKELSISGRDYLYYDCSQEIGVTKSTSPDGTPSTTDRQYFKFRGSDMGDLVTAYSDYSCVSASVKCFLRVSRIVFTPKLNSSDFSYLESGDYYYFRFTTTNYLFLGNSKEFYTNSVTDLVYNFGGIDSYLNFNFQDQYSCRDNESLPCQVAYKFGHDRDDISLSGNYSSFLTSGSVGSGVTAYNFEFIDNPYNTSSNLYQVSAFDGLTYFIPLTTKTNFNSTGYLVWDGYIFFYKTDDFVPVVDSDSVDPDSVINQENAIIQDNVDSANSSNSLLGNISIPIFNPISSWLVLFTDSQCIDISTLSGWFGLSTQHLCSPWHSNIRDVLTPIISVGGTLLLFGYAIRWLNGSSYYKGDING